MNLLFRDLQTAGLAIDAFAILLSVVIWRDTYDRNRSEQVGLTTTVCTAIFFLLFNALSNILDGIALELIKHIGEEREVEIIDWYQKLQEPAQSVDRRGVKGMCQLLQQIPGKERDALIAKYSVSMEVLERYAGVEA